MDVVLGLVQPILDWFSANPMSKLFLVLVLFDTGTGMLLATREQRLNSSIGTDGLIRKLGIIIGIGLTEVLEPYLGIPLLSEITAAGFCVTEGLSVVENLGKVGVTMPEAVTAALAKLGPRKDG